MSDEEEKKENHEERPFLKRVKSMSIVTKIIYDAVVSPGLRLIIDELQEFTAKTVVDVLSAMANYAEESKSFASKHEDFLRRVRMAAHDYRTAVDDAEDYAQRIYDTARFPPLLHFLTHHTPTPYIE